MFQQINQAQGEDEDHMQREGHEEHEKEAVVTPSNAIIHPGKKLEMKESIN